MPNDPSYEELLALTKSLGNTVADQAESLEKKERALRMYAEWIKSDDELLRKFFEQLKSECESETE